MGCAVPRLFCKLAGRRQNNRSGRRRLASGSAAPAKAASAAAKAAAAASGGGEGRIQRGVASDCFNDWKHKGERLALRQGRRRGISREQQLQWIAGISFT